MWIRKLIKDDPEAFIEVLVIILILLVAAFFFANIEDVMCESFNIRCE